MPTDPAASNVLAALAQAGVWLQLLPVLGAALLLLRRGAAQRGALAGTLMLYALSVAGIALGAALAAGGLAHAGTIVGRIAILLMGLMLIRLAGQFLFHAILPALHRPAPSILEDLVVLAGYVVWGMVLLSRLGLDLSSIVTTSAVITAVVAFSLQDTLGNILGGMALQLDDSIHVGDWIKVDDVTGRVLDIRWRSTSVETRNWETVVIPNGVLMRNKFTILGRRAGQPLQWRRWIWFSVEFAVPPQRVIDAVEQALARAQISHVARTPAPNCVTMDINDSVVKYALRYWLTDLSVDDPTDSAVRSRVFAALRRAGIGFALPEQTVHLIKQGDKHELRAQERDIEQRVGIVNQIELFASLSPDERREIALRLVYAPFAAGETVTQQGAVAHWLYLLVQGSVEVVVDSAAGERRKLARIDAAAGAAFFGEMGLLTGAPRAATVIAASEVDCYRLDKQAFEGVLRRRPAIADEIAQIMARRRSDLELLQGDLEKAAQARVQRDGHYELLARIRSFFGLNESGGRPA